MAFDLSNFRLRGGHMKLNRALQKRADCATGGLYLSPTFGATVDALKPLEIKWEPSCINGTDKIDIYLKAPQTATPLLHTYSGKILFFFLFPFMVLNHPYRCFRLFWQLHC